MKFKLSTLLITGMLGALPATAATITMTGDAIKGGELLAGTFTEAPATGQNNGTNNTPGAEVVGNAIDAGVGSEATKYLNFGREDTGYIVIPGVGASIVTGIDFVTGNDAVNRDPASYILYGSNTLTSLAPSTFTLTGDGFTQISDGSLSLPNTGINLTGNLTLSDGRGYAQSITIANSASYTSYILVFPTVRGADNSMQIASAILTGTVVPEPAAASFAVMGLLGLALRRRRI